MLSILLPIYNTPCGQLILELCRQATALQIPFEIIAMEDGSTTFADTNANACRKAVEEVGNACGDPDTTVHKIVRHIRLTENIGRSAIRNRLAEESTGLWLLFMDCDSEIGHTDYLQRYLAAIRQQTGNESSPTVICGGRIYRSREFYPHECRLHWTIGSLREPAPRHSHRCKAFLSNNFMIRRTDFLAIRFDETMKHYGHEDTRFGIEIQRAGGNIRYIDNPVIHLQLDDNRRFLAKTEEAVRNLVLLRSTFLTETEADGITLLRYAKKLRRYGILSLLNRYAKQLKPWLECQLNREHPSPGLYDLYKLLVIAQESFK